MPFSMKTFVDVVNPNTSDQHRNTYKRPDSGWVHLYISNKHRGAVVARGAHNPWNTLRSIDRNDAMLKNQSGSPV